MPDPTRFCGLCVAALDDLGRCPHCELLWSVYLSLGEARAFKTGVEAGGSMIDGWCAVQRWREHRRNDGKETPPLDP